MTSLRGCAGSVDKSPWRRRDWHRQVLEAFSPQDLMFSGDRVRAAACGKLRRMEGLEVDVSGLYGLPSAEFTRARNELAKEARARGDSEQAERIKGLQKPTLAAWVLNMLARSRESELAALLRVGEQAEAAQASLLAGDGDPGQLREASEQLRGAARNLADEAGEILVKDAHAAREQTLRRVAAALEGRAVSADGRRQLQKGEFAEEPEPAGFELFAQLSAPPAGKSLKTAAQKTSRQASRPADGRKRAQARRAAQQAVEDARAELRKRRAERTEAEAALRDAERSARAKQREAEQAWQLVERRRQGAQRAQAAELEARGGLDEAQGQRRIRQ
jgi:hypothetical protein